jgi:hypothetical protein
MRLEDLPSEVDRKHAARAEAADSVAAARPQYMPMWRNQEKTLLQCSANTPGEDLGFYQTVGTSRPTQ